MNLLRHVDSEGNCTGGMTDQPRSMGRVTECGNRYIPVDALHVSVAWRAYGATLLSDRPGRMFTVNTRAH